MAITAVAADGKAAAAAAAEHDRVPLPQLLGVGTSYRPDTLPYVPRAELERTGRPTYPALEDWVQIFRHSIESFQHTAAADPSRPPDEAAAAAWQFAAAYRVLVDDAERRVLAACSGGSASARGGTDLGCLQLCALREDALRAAGFADIFRPIKARENEAALALLPGVCAELDEHADPRDRWQAALRGVFAGNVFDLGCASTTSLYHGGSMCFFETRAGLVLRPWAVDDLDPALDRLCSHKYSKAVLFVDNSGSDVILGMLPFARELLRAGTRVVVAANQLPSINDITAAELDALLPQVAAADPALCKGISTGQLTVVSSGSGLPVVDLSQVSAELAAAAEGADLVVLEGMGRSIETNLHARFSCDALNVGMIKHPEVAAALGGRLYDCVVRFRAAGEL